VSATGLVSQSGQLSTFRIELKVGPTVVFHRRKVFGSYMGYSDHSRACVDLKIDARNRRISAQRGQRRSPPPAVLSLDCTQYRDIRKRALVGRTTREAPCGSNGGNCANGISEARSIVQSHQPRRGQPGTGDGRSRRRARFARQRRSVVADVVGRHIRLVPVSLAPLRFPELTYGDKSNQYRIGSRLYTNATDYCIR
jgi:hypothetical protein